jgi:hypothetical protein
MVLLVGAIALLLVNTAVLYWAFVAEPDPQSGLIFIFLPLYELVGLLPFVVFAVRIHRRART